MTIWYKQGVYGDLSPDAAEGLRLTERLYTDNGEDVFITSIRDGSHMAGSYHVIGRAFDMRKGKISLKDHQKKLGKKFQVIDEATHRHVEYDPR